VTAPSVGGVKIRLMGDESDVAAVAEALAMLPALTQGRIQLGEVSDPYPNRRGSGTRIYVDAYVVDEPATATAQPAESDGRKLPAMQVNRPARSTRPTR
jgi:hypothetical protein